MRKFVSLLRSWMLCAFARGYETACHLEEAPAGKAMLASYEETVYSLIIAWHDRGISG